MTILKYLFIFLVLYFISNVAYWGYQEYIYYEDMQTIRSLGNTINIAIVTIEEKEQSLARSKQKLNEEKIKLDKLVVDKKFAEYNELVSDLNAAIEEYNALIALGNQNVAIVNELIVKSGTRQYLFPIDSYTPELYREIN